MINQDDAQPGETVWLRPGTKQASAECYARLAAVLVDVKTQWPYVKVNIPDASSPDGVRPLTTHRLNVGLRPKTVKKEKGGDQVGAEDGVPLVRVKTMGKPVPPIDPACGYEEDMLF
jgi:hypothetical protein